MICLGRKIKILYQNANFILEYEIKLFLIAYICQEKSSDVLQF